MESDIPSSPGSDTVGHLAPSPGPVWCTDAWLQNLLRFCAVVLSVQILRDPVRLLVCIVTEDLAGASVARKGYFGAPVQGLGSNGGLNSLVWRSPQDYDA
ncbi:hypothetical protein CNYM01_14164 [Colletotrichum nymphaeae SA-01]|uniref:Uncharacterized protein n=1 Tax=Colletotrichum nymphaeae SA-01 TaxID=1460502 RepID=A0A135U344_9PEZI|nr:hypothetical protein CNYM01_14164 [Colletotrichum nymphaeae SA-01]